MATYAEADAQYRETIFVLGMRASKVLEGLTVFVSPSADFSYRTPFVTRGGVMQYVTGNGANAVKRTTTKVTHILTAPGDKEEVFAKAEALGVPVVSIDFFLESVNQKRLLDASNYVVARGPVTPKQGTKRARVETPPTSSPRSKKARTTDGSTSSPRVPSVPLSSEVLSEEKQLEAVLIADAGIVHEGPDGAWSASLKQGSKRSGKYYNIKLIEYGGRFFLHTKSGSAIGAGEVHQEECSSLESAKVKFEQKFLEKTKNHWANRGDFKPKAGFFTINSTAKRLSSPLY